MSILVGIAVDKGLIESVNDSISKYLPGLRVSGIEELTIESLLLMHSGIYFTGIKMPFHEASKIYFTNNCRRLIKKIRISDPVDSYFHYNDYHLLLLTLIIENVTGKSLIDFLWENLLEPLGWEFPLLLTIDSTKNKFPKMESGVVCRAIDLAKLGLMLLNDGKVNNKNIVSTQWIKASTAPNTMVIEKEYYRHYKEKPWGRMCFYKGLGYYKYLWWGNPIDAMTYDFYAMGILGQFLYVSPRKNTVIIRLGKRWGIHGWLPQILKEIADKL
jgi:CubicO group peptidase (beta-lactamase class C family)